MTSGASPKGRLIALLDLAHDEIAEHEEAERADPGLLMVAKAILLLAEIELVTR